MTLWKLFHTQLQKKLIPKWLINEKIDVDLMEFVQTTEDMKNHKNKGLGKGLSLTFKQWTKQYYVIKKKKTKNKNTKCVRKHHENEYLLC
jgi:hypothetical protein